MEEGERNKASQAAASSAGSTPGRLAQIADDGKLWPHQDFDAPVRGVV